MDFHKSQTREFEDRIDSLLKVNKELKARLESLLKNNSESSSTSYYKGQIEQSEKTIETLNQKLRKFAEENRTLKQETVETGSKYAKEYEEKQFDMENQLQEKSLNQIIAQRVVALKKS